MNARRFKIGVGAVLLVAATVLPVAQAQIYNWSTGEVIPGTEGITPGPGVDLRYWTGESHNLRYADLSGGLDLHDGLFWYSWLDNAWFVSANLTGADFRSAQLLDADFSGATIMGADFHAGFAGTGISAAQLYSTVSYQTGNLQAIRLYGNDLTGWSFANQNLTNARLGGATLTDASLAGAIVTGADLSATGLTIPQLYSTASYQSGNLVGITLGSNNLAGCNLAGKNLSDATFIDARLTDADMSHANLTNAWLWNANLDRADMKGATLGQAYLFDAQLTNATLTDVSGAGAVINGANLSRADTRGSTLTAVQFATATTDNTILPDGQVVGLSLGAYEALKVRDYYGGIAITVDDAFQMDPDSTLAIIFSDDTWGSTISLADGVLADLDGALSLAFAPGTDVGSLLGVTFDLFNWNGGLLPGEVFANVIWPSGFDWNTSDLYAGGTVTLTAVPEPATALLLSLGALTFWRRR